MPPRRQTLVVDNAGTVSRYSGSSKAFLNHRAAAAAAYLPPLSATNEPGRVPVRASVLGSTSVGVYPGAYKGIQLESSIHKLHKLQLQ